MDKQNILIMQIKQNVIDNLKKISLDKKERIFLLDFISLRNKK